MSIVYIIYTEGDASKPVISPLWHLKDITVSTATHSGVQDRALAVNATSGFVLNGGIDT
jgi:hypothetical protein